MTNKSQTKIDISQLKIDSPNGAHSAEMEKMLKDAMEEIHYFDLIQFGNESSFKKVEKINNDLPQEGGMRISFSGGGKGLNYKNIDTKEYLKESGSFGKDYIITDSLETYDWQITREKGKILNYDVRKATAIIDSATTLEAWYSPDLSFKSGPVEFWGLPGLILKITEYYTGVENRETYYEATELEVLTDKDPIEKPTKGEFITEKEFYRQQDEKMKEMREMREQGVDLND